jgi:putative narL family two-component response regulator
VPSGLAWSGEEIGVDQACSIIVVDDHDIIAKGCRLVFEDAGMPWSVRWYTSLHDVEWPDGRALVILDLRLEDGSTPTQNLREIERRGLPVIAYTSAESPILVREAIAGGVLAIVRKSGPSSDLVLAIQDALDGRPSAGLDWAAALDADEDFVVDYLAPIEADVLAHYAEGEKSETVARILSLSKNTPSTPTWRASETSTAPLGARRTPASTSSAERPRMGW